MKRPLQLLLFTLLTLGTYSQISCQTLIDFESLLNATDTFERGEEVSGFSEPPFYFPNEFDEEFDIWSGQWAISSSTDSVTPNFNNLFGSIQGEGAQETTVYAVGQAPFEGRLNFRSEEPVQLDNIFITNTTYTYYTIRDGNQFAKAFGGPSGEDPDYFFIRWKGWNDGSPTDSLDAYLADYTFPDHSKDYILDDWMEVDLSVLGTIDSVTIEFFSSDEGQFGINTPLFFCLDQLGFSETSSSFSARKDGFSIYPNPASETINLRGNSGQSLREIILFNAGGEIVLQSTPENRHIDIHSLNPGLYFVLIKDQEGWHRSTFVKN